MPRRPTLILTALAVSASLTALFAGAFATTSIVAFAARMLTSLRALGTIRCRNRP
jgi:hypothetical protein